MLTGRWKSVFSVLGRVAFVVVGGVAVLSLVLGGQDVSPLGGSHYSPQRVLSTVEGVDGPAITYDSPGIVIEGTLCSAADHPLKVRTVINWQAYTPAGEEVTGTFATVGFNVEQVRKPGCVDFQFTNQLPPDVVLADRAANILGNELRWRVQGYEEPELDDRTFGAPKSFESDLFDLVPTGETILVPTATAPGTVPTTTPTTTRAPRTVPTTVAPPTPTVPCIIDVFGVCI